MKVAHSTRKAQDLPSLSGPFAQGPPDIDPSNLPSELLSQPILEILPGRRWPFILLSFINTSREPQRNDHVEVSPVLHRVCLVGGSPSGVVGFGSFPMKAFDLAGASRHCGEDHALIASHARIALYSFMSRLKYHPLEL